MQGANSVEMKRAPDTWNIWCFIGAGIMATFYLTTSLYIASHRLFWFDEIFTVRIARLPHWVTIWTALAHAVDAQPPFYYTVVRIFDNLGGHSDFAARLPSALALTAGLLITFDCARHLTDGLHGLIAFSVLTCSTLLYYGHEARPYAIYFMLAALSLWLWTNTRPDNKLGIAFFGAVLFVAVTMHYYAVLLLVPYALWEFISWRRWQPPSYKLIAGVVGAVVPAALLSPLILAFSHQFSRKSLSGAYRLVSLSILEDVFSHFFPLGLLLLALIVIRIVLVGAKNKSIVLQPMQSGEAVSWLFLCIPLVGFVIAQKTSAFHPRYFIGALPGIAVGLSCWIWRLRDTTLVSLGIFLLLMATGVTRQVAVVRNPNDDPIRSSTRTRQYLGLEKVVRSDGKQFMLFSQQILYMGAEYYSKYPSECILLISSELAVNPADHPDLLVNLSAFHPLQFWTLDDLRKHAKETALIEAPQDVLETMKQDGYKIEVRFANPLEVVS